VEFTQFWSEEKYKDSGIYFCTAHPGWADTQAVRTSMPDFYAKFGKHFRTPQQGADTIIWAVISDKARRNFPNGSFFEDRQAVKKHLPLSGTESSNKDREIFIRNLETLINK
jgi:dehydrogenase/reductase SDR family member 12